MPLTKDQIIDFFHKEFTFLREIQNEKIVVCDLSIPEAREAQDKDVCRPGVYVFWHPVHGVIKVGRHLLNSRKRALEHIRDNTGNEMNKHGEDPDTKIFLFNIRHEVDIDSNLHWLFALEVFFELKLGPKIKSKRKG